MKKKRIVIRVVTSTVFILLFVQFGFAQMERNKNFEENQEKIKAQKVAFITDRLDLSSEEAKLFWPVYEEHDALMKDEMKTFREGHDFKPEDIASMNEADANKFLNDHLAHEQRMLDLRKKFRDNLLEVISPNKILMLFEAEKDFRMELMKRLSNKRGPEQRRPQGR